MIAIVCVDNKNGIMFNHRRQSQDRVLIDEILKMVSLEDKTLYLSEYSRPLFPKDAKVSLTSDFLSLSENDYAFLEDKLTEIPAKHINKLIVCKWNRDYPADVRLPYNLDCYKKKMLKEFKGSSHKKITIESYT